MRRMPSLDGFRAISIGLVLVGHEFSPSMRNYVGDLANLGVRCFFVLSGFLITSLLLQEHEQTGSISLRRFYSRRTFRIFPAFYAFLLAMFVLSRLGLVPEIDRSSWIHAVTYTINYQPLTERAWNLGHLWSLAVEEQFYLLWPATVLLLRPRKALVAALITIAVVPLIRYVTWRYFPGQASGIKWQFQTVCDALATGCLLAGVRDEAWGYRHYREFLSGKAFWIAPLTIAVLCPLVVGRPRVNYLVGQTLTNVAIVLCIDRVVRFSTRPVGRLLNWRPVAFVGVLSYSIYLWQQIFFNADTPSWVTRFPINLIGTLAAAWLSYTLVERPFLRLRGRFAPPVAEGITSSALAIPSRVPASQ